MSCDGDTSTNDMVTIFSTAEAKNKNIQNINDPNIKEFDSSLHLVLLNLAKKNCSRWRRCIKIYNSSS